MWMLFQFVIFAGIMWVPINYNWLGNSRWMTLVVVAAAIGATFLITKALTAAIDAYAPSADSRPGSGRQPPD